MTLHPDTVIKCEHLTHYYGKRFIYEDLSFEVPRGRILGLLGKNGTGKTTTINILNGYLRPAHGACYMFGEEIQDMNPRTKQRIALLIEGHVQYSFMNITQIERFYSAFYPRWNKNVYYDLMNLLKVAPKQKISTMSCGQRSQVALGLIMAQNADLLILDDFSLGLDPGYRRLFIDYLRDYAKSEEKTVFLTSHIIQDMEKLIDDCIILDYGRILLQMPIRELLGCFKRYTFRTTASLKALPVDDHFYYCSVIRGSSEVHTFRDIAYLTSYFNRHGIPYTDLREEAMTLEDAFIGLTGKY